MKKIYIDSPIYAEYPFLSRDYNSKFLFNLAYDPIFIQIKKGIYKSNIVTESLEGNILKIKFNKNKKWSNGEYLTAQHFEQTLKYILLKKTDYVRHLDFIEGVREYLNEDGQLGDVGIHSEENTVKIHLIRTDSYQEIFSTVEFSPIYFKGGEPNIEISSGPLTIRDKKNKGSKIILSPNMFYKKNYFMNEKLVIIEHSANSLTNLREFKSNNICMTGTTIFNESEIEHMKEDKCYETDTSSVEFNLIFSESLDNKLQTVLVGEVVKNLEGYSNVIKLNQRFRGGDINKYIPRKKLISIGYSDFYPNKVIVDIIKNTLETINIESEIVKIPLSDMWNSKNDFDILLDLSFSIVSNDLDIWLSKMPYISENKIDVYVELINNWIEYSNKENKKKVEIFLMKHSNQKLIGKFIHNYLIDQKMTLSKDVNDNYRLV